MTGQPFRRQQGGLIDRTTRLRFTFDGTPFEGHPGDTLASALLASGVRLVGRGFKYHRPRGIMTAGPEEPNALLQIGEGALSEPNCRATQVPLSDGLVARSQNRWPSLGFDIAALNGVFSGLIPAGFYYKTFMGPASFWMTYEAAIRRMAGLGKAPAEADSETYEHHYDFADVLVVGSGPAGLSAAQAATRAGARVVLAEQDFALGGSLLSEPDDGPIRIDGEAAGAWLRDVEAALRAALETRVMVETTVLGLYDGNMAILCERCRETGPGKPRFRLRHLRAKKIVLATGAIERPLVFGNNDRPGTMLAGAARSYLNRFAVRPGRRAVVFTNNDSAYELVPDAVAAGLGVAAVVDVRETIAPHWRERLDDLGVPILTGMAVTETLGRKAVRGVRVARLSGDRRGVAGGEQTFDCDLVLSSGGWNPSVHLFSHAGGKLRYDEARAAFVPDRGPDDVSCAGAVNSLSDTASCLAEGWSAAEQCLGPLGFAVPGAAPKSPVAEPGQPITALWCVPLRPGSKAKRFVDHQNDVTADDVALAERENYASVEHLKRYTTLGMGTDQGRTGNVNGLGVLADIRGLSPGEVGTTTFRPPYTPVTLGAVAGPEVGPRLAPVRRTPIHDWHEQNGAVFVNSGAWLRARYYPRAGESLAHAANREARHVRAAAGICDVSTLGKIDVQGRDAGMLLDRIYTNSFSTLKIGRCRYGLMLREDGIVYDDGVAVRLAEDHFLMSATTANAARVLQDLEVALQVYWRDLKVSVNSATDIFASMSVTGPKSREILQLLQSDIDFSSEAIPFMGTADGTIEGIAARVFRISFSGELGFELTCGAGDGEALWRAVVEKGRPHGLEPYGVEALDILRTEVGHVVIGSEINGNTTADDLGFSGMCSTNKTYIGRRLKDRPALAAPGREQLIGIVPVDDASILRSGMQLSKADRVPIEAGAEGHVTSGNYSPNLGHHIGIALLANGRERLGEEVWAHSPLHDETVRVRVVSHHFVDPQGVRVRG